MKIGKAELKFLGHSGFMITNGKTVYIDPYSLTGDKQKADVVLITHGHHDHCSVADLQKICRKGTVVVVPPDCQSKITKLEDVNMQIVEQGDEINLDGIKIQAVPAYNNDKDFHPKSEGWFGYIIKFENVIIYHAGDTDIIPEMEKLTGYGKQGNEFVALLPMGGKFTMNVDEAVKAVSILKPSMAIPMHYGAIIGNDSDAEEFVKLCREQGFAAEKLEKE